MLAAIRRAGGGGCSSTVHGGGRRWVTAELAANKPAAHKVPIPAAAVYIPASLFCKRCEVLLTRLQCGSVFSGSPLPVHTEPNRPNN